MLFVKVYVIRTLKKVNNMISYKKEDLGFAREYNRCELYCRSVAVKMTNS